MKVGYAGYCPPADIIKANFDAAVWEDGSATVGCVFKNKAGHILLAAGFECIYESVEEAEIVGT